MASDLRRVTFRQLHVFAAVARRLNVTAAARELHLTQPAVTMQVKLLEAQCGAPLFERMGRRIRLTENGVELAHCATQVTELLRETEERLDALHGLRKGLLKIGAVSTAKYFAPSVLAAFTALHPGVTVRFSVGNREEMIARLAEDEADLIIMGRPPVEIETQAAPFARHPLVIIAPPAHALAKKRRIRFARLARERFLIREPGSGTRASMERVFKEHGLAVEPGMEVASNETIKQAVMAGMGLGFLSAHTVGLELATKRLVTLDVVGMPVMREWYVMHRKAKRLSPVAAAFREFLLAKGAPIIAKAVASK
jgi:LysR family transcriptional regulator, low CO2-responsive transcriptional regulator